MKTNQCKHHINKVRNKTHMIISMNTEKKLTKFNIFNDINIKQSRTGKDFELGSPKYFEGISMTQCSHFF